MSSVVLDQCLIGFTDPRSVSTCSDRFRLAVTKHIEGHQSEAIALLEDLASEYQNEQRNNEYAR